MGELKLKRGRPAKEPDDLLSLDDALESLRKFLFEKYKSEKAADKLCPAKGTLYNKLSSGEVHRYGNRRCALVSFAEIKRLVG